MKLSVHKLQKKLKREQQHEQWLLKNLKSSKQHWECRKNILKLNTKIRVDLTKVNSSLKLVLKKDVIELVIYNIFVFHK